MLGVAVATLVLSIGAGALLGLHRDISPLTGSLALVAGGASGLVAIARELGGDDRVVAVVQYLRVALITASMPIVVTARLPRREDRPRRARRPKAARRLGMSASACSSSSCSSARRRAGSSGCPASGLLGPMAVTIALELTGTSFGLSVPMALVQLGYAVIGWQAGVAFTRESMRAIGRALPAGARPDRRAQRRDARASASCWPTSTGISPLEGYLSTSPGGIYAVLATAVETGSNVTFIIAAQVVRVLLMLFAAPLMARGFVDADAAARLQPGQHLGRAGNPSASPTDGPPRAPRRGSAAAPVMPAARFVTSETPSTSAPAARAAIVSCTVDMPTRSAPSVRSIRISAGVS